MRSNRYYRVADELIRFDPLGAKADFERGQNRLALVFEFLFDLAEDPVDDIGFTQGLLQPGTL